MCCQDCKGFKFNDWPSQSIIGVSKFFLHTGWLYIQELNSTVIYNTNFLGGNFITLAQMAIFLQPLKLQPTKNTIIIHLTDVRPCALMVFVMWHECISISRWGQADFFSRMCMISGWRWLICMFGDGWFVCLISPIPFLLTNCKCVAHTRTTASKNLAVATFWESTCHFVNLRDIALSHSIDLAYIKV